jgi:hypothetical protein
METMGILGLILAAAVALGGWLLKLYGDSQRHAGKLEERDEQNKQAAEAKKRADDVLAEHRTIDDAAEKLRRGEF